MQPFVVTERGFDLVLWQPGRMPARVHALRGSGLAVVALLPAVAVVSAEGLDPAEAAAAVAAQRDRLLEAWMSEAPPPAEEPRAGRASLDRNGPALMIQLKSGAVLRAPLSRLGSLAGAPLEDLEAIEVLASGEVLRWPKLGQYRRVPELVQGLLGGEARPAPQAAPKIKSLLGLVLCRVNYMSQEQVQAVAAEQVRLAAEGRKVPFGQIAVEAGYLKPDQLKRAIQIQESLSRATEETRPLGFYLLESATVLPSQLLSALEQQNQTGERLGDILIARGWISQDLLSTFLGRQSAERRPAPAPAAAAPAPVAPAKRPTTDGGSKVKSLLGIILERENYVSQAQVREAIAEQERRRQAGKTATFGEVALEKGFITVEQLKFAIALQAKLAYTPGKAKPLGFFLIENGVVKPSLIQKALEEQQRSGKRLGELLVEQGLISEGMLEVFLNMQKTQV